MCVKNIQQDRHHEPEQMIVGVLDLYRNQTQDTKPKKAKYF